MRLVAVMILRDGVAGYILFVLRQGGDQEDRYAVMMCMRIRNDTIGTLLQPWLSVPLPYLCGCDGILAIGESKVLG